MKSIWFDFYSHKIKIASNSSRLLGRIKGLYGYFSCGPAKNPEISFRAYVSGKGKSILYQGGKVIYFDGNPDCFFIFTDWAIINEVAKRIGKYSKFHAAALSLDGCGMILPGTSCAGKSTLSALLLSEGFKFLSDELSLLDIQTRTLFPFPKSISLERRALSFVPGLKRFARDARLYKDFDGVKRFYLDPLKIKGASISKKARLEYIIFPMRISRGRNFLRPIRTGNAIAKLLRNAVGVTFNSRAEFDRLVDLAKRTRCYELGIKDFAGVAELLKEGLNGV